jgi:hypothetical protein
MKTKRNAAISLAIVPVVLFAFTWAKCQNQANEKAQAAPKPTPEMDRPKFYLGEWDYTETYLKTACNPNGGKNTGIYTSKLGPGGNSLINTFHSQGPAGDLEGLLILTWDAKRKGLQDVTYLATIFPALSSKRASSKETPWFSGRKFPRRKQT